MQFIGSYPEYPQFCLRYCTSSRSGSNFKELAEEAHGRMIVACGGAYGVGTPDWARRHTVVVSSTGRVFSWGQGSNGQLGTGSLVDQLSPAIIGGELEDKRVRAVSCGDCHTAAVTVDGKLYTWGDGSYGQLGHGTVAKRCRPTEVKMLAGSKRVVGVSCAECHTACFTEDGWVYTCGVGALGQLGHGDTRGKWSPGRVGGALLSVKVVAVSAGNCHTAAVSIDGQLFIWGDSTFGQLGLGNTDRSLVPQKNLFLEDHFVTAVSCGRYHTACVTEDGALCTWGDNAHGQLGCGDMEGQLKPRRVIGSLENTRVRGVSCGNSHTVASTHHGEDRPGRVFSWGEGRFGQLGLGHTCDVFEPTEVQGLPPATHVGAVSCGCIHTCVVTENRRVFIWGHIWGSRGPEGVELRNRLSRDAELVVRPVEVQGISKIDVLQPQPSGLMGPISTLVDLAYSTLSNTLDISDALLLADLKKEEVKKEKEMRLSAERERDEALVALARLSQGKFSDSSGIVSRLEEYSCLSRPPEVSDKGIVIGGDGESEECAGESSALADEDLHAKTEEAKQEVESSRDRPMAGGEPTPTPDNQIQTVEGTEIAADEDQVPPASDEQVCVAEAQDEDNTLMPGALTVTVMRARDLIPADLNGLCDPYVRLHVASAVDHAKTTQVVKKCLDPEWNETFVYHLEPEQRLSSLTVTCFDWDQFSAPDSLGEYVLALNSLSTDSECTQWCPLTQKGKSQHQGEVELRYTFVPLTCEAIDNQDADKNAAGAEGEGPGESELLADGGE